jgi:hypothetical protein
MSEWITLALCILVLGATGAALAIGLISVLEDAPAWFAIAVTYLAVCGFAVASSFLVVEFVA